MAPEKLKAISSYSSGSENLSGRASRKCGNEYPKYWLGVSNSIYEADGNENVVFNGGILAKYYDPQVLIYKGIFY